MQNQMNGPNILEKSVCTQRCTNWAFTATSENAQPGQRLETGGANVFRRSRNDKLGVEACSWACAIWESALESFRFQCLKQSGLAFDLPSTGQRHQSVVEIYEQGISRKPELRKPNTRRSRKVLPNKAKLSTIRKVVPSRVWMGLRADKIETVIAELVRYNRQNVAEVITTFKLSAKTEDEANNGTTAARNDSMGEQQRHRQMGQ